MGQLSQKQIENLLSILSTKMDDSILSIDPNLIDDDTTIASQYATKLYIDNYFLSIPSFLVYRGTFNITSTSLFSDLGEVFAGNVFLINGNEIIEGITLNTGDLIMFKLHAAIPTANEVSILDSTEDINDLHKNTTILNDDTFNTASNLTIPTADSVKQFLVNYSNKKESFTEIKETFIPTTSIIKNNNYNITLQHNTLINFIVDVYIDNLKLKSTQFQHTIGTNLVTINVNYDLDPTDIIEVKYSY